MIGGEHGRTVDDGVGRDDDVDRAGGTNDGGVPQCTLDIQDQRFVRRRFRRESEGDLLPVVRVLGRRRGAVAELQNLRWARDEEVGRCAFDPS